MITSTASVFETAHASSVEEVTAALGGDATRGLSESESDERRRRHGPNALPEPPPKPAWKVLARQFASPLVWILLVAALAALLLDAASDAVVILVVVILNGGIGAFQEGRAERSLEALRRLATQKTRVVRDGLEQEVEAQLLVPGDLVLVAAGDAVTADARLIEEANLTVAEAALTGESVPVAKSIAPCAEDCVLADRINMLYSGTSIAAGRGRAMVVATGTATEIGRIAGLAEGGKEPQTPLERRVAGFGRTLAWAAMATFAVIALIGLWRRMPFGEIAMVGISQVVGMVPEGLPVAMTVALAVGVTRMARRGVIVRRLSAVETLGSTTLIASDKTGTLTRNEMTVTRVQLPSGRELTVTGSGYSPEGELRDGERSVDAHSLPDLAGLLTACVLCNDAKISAPDADDARHRPLGDPTEAALVTLAMKGKVDPSAERTRLPRTNELPFDATLKLMATQHREGEQSFVVIKGAPEVVLGLCAQARVDGHDVPLDAGLRASIRTGGERMARDALRLLALARVEGPALDGGDLASLRGKAVLLGIVGELDPPREGVAEAVQRCRAAGIRPIMITGDHTVTGMAVARMLHIAGAEDRAIDGPELTRLSDAELAQRLEHTSVFARIEPAQKLRIVEAFQSRGEIVAMTGDGVNDAPALMRADVGVAMGITGTDVAKQAAKVVITDDNFATIVAAVEEGRLVYRNIKKAVLLLFSTSLAEVLVLVVAIAAGLPAPFAAVQILWNNLVTEGVITVNLIMEPAEGDEMRLPPVLRGETLISRELWGRIALLTPTIALVTLGWFVVRRGAGLSLEALRTETFTLLAVCEWFNVLNCRSATKTALTLDVVRNRWLLGGLVLGNLLQVAVVYLRPLGDLFHTVPLALDQVLWIGAAASTVLWVEEARKLIARARLRRAVARV